MTRNQIEYLNYLETKRSNLAREKETHRANRAAETNKDAVLQETRRYNVVSQAETQRSNMAKEGENLRHNVATEGLARLQLEETERSNRANEVVRQQTVAETERSNRANEVNQQVRNAETERTNRANEVIRQEANFVNLSQYHETRRHNVAQEGIGRTQANASLTQAGASALNAQSNYASTQAGLTMNNWQIDKESAMLKETERHNKATEIIDMYGKQSTKDSADNKMLVDLFKTTVGVATGVRP